MSLAICRFQQNGVHKVHKIRILFFGNAWGDLPIFGQNGQITPDIPSEFYERVPATPPKTNHVLFGTILGPKFRQNP